MQKPPIRLKFKDDHATPAPVTPTAPVQAKTKKPDVCDKCGVKRPPKQEPPPFDRFESLKVQCGHTVSFGVWNTDLHYARRKAKREKRDCTDCIEVRQKAEHATAVERRAVKAAAKRLADQATVRAVYDAATTTWTGTLTASVSGVAQTFTGRASSVHHLLRRFGEQYRAACKGEVVSEFNDLAPLDLTKKGSERDVM